MNIDIKHTRSTLQLLNKELKKKCGDLSIEFDNYYDMKGRKSSVMLYDKENAFQLLLCLNKNNDCIATISCKLNEDGSMEISSKTDPKYEGRKYNLLLRCAIVLLASSIFITPVKKVTRIISRAINPISILLMAKYFRATNEQLDDYITRNGLMYETLTLDDMKNFYDELNETPEFETEEEEALYLENQSSFGEPVLLSIDVNDAKIVTNTQRLLYSSILQIKCPDSGGIGGKRKKKHKTSKKNTKKKCKKTQKIRGHPVRPHL